MEKYQINIKILNRSIPVWVNTEEEEANIKQALEIIEEKIATYQNKFNVKDENYLILMFCLDIATENVQLNKELALHGTDFSSKLTAINQLIDSTQQSLSAAINN